MEKTRGVAESRMKRSVQALQEDFKTVRTGRASAALFDRVRVNAYEAMTPLNQIATISVPEARWIIF